MIKYLDLKAINKPYEHVADEVERKESDAPQDDCNDAEHYHFDQGVLFHRNVPPFNKLLTYLLYYGSMAFVKP